MLNMEYSPKEQILESNSMQSYYLRWVLLVWPEILGQPGQETMLATASIDAFRSFSGHDDQGKGRQGDMHLVAL